MKSIAVVGEFASGKTTLANYLTENYDFTRVSFAGRLKAMAADVYGGGDAIAKDKEYEVWPLDAYGDSLDVENISGRQLLQQLGQSVKTMDKLFWVKYLLADMEAGTYGSGPFVSDDCRFPYEAEALRDRDFLIVRIMTPEDVRIARYELMYGRRPTREEMNHPSETEVKTIQYDLLVDGTAPVSLTAQYLLGLAEGVAA